MREILFRGKRIDNGEWVYGLLFRIGDTYANIVEKGTEVMCTVLTNTIGQFTGLTDKNGNKIFEGDIVKETIASNYQPIGQIYYAPEFCQWRIEYINSIVLIGHIGKGRSYTILGNIHDNPELLEVTK